MTLIPHILQPLKHDQVLRCATNHLHPAIQRGDWLIVRPAHTANPGDTVVVETGDDDWNLGEWPGVGGHVIGKVVGLYRSVP